MTNKEFILSDKIKIALSNYFIYKYEDSNLETVIDDYFLSVFDIDDITCEKFKCVVNCVSVYIFHELYKIISTILIKFYSSGIALDDTKNIFSSIEFEFKNSGINIDLNVINSISAYYFFTRFFNYMQWDKIEFHPTLETIILSIINKYIIDYNDYISCFLTDMIFQSGYKFNSDTFNKKTDGRKGKRGPIKKNIETEKLVSAITSATVEKYPNVSDHKLTQAIQKHLYSKKIENSYNTVKKWVIARREQEGTTHNGEESYKGVISLVIP